MGPPINSLSGQDIVSWDDRVRGLTMREITDAGAKRVSVGGALTWTAVEAMARAAERIRDEGDFSALDSQSHIRGWLSA